MLNLGPIDGKCGGIGSALRPVNAPPLLRAFAIIPTYRKDFHLVLRAPNVVVVSVKPMYEILTSQCGSPTMHYLYIVVSER
jgi:hypothetical protein